MFDMPRCEHRGRFGAAEKADLRLYCRREGRAERRIDLDVHELMDRVVDHPGSPSCLPPPLNRHVGFGHAFIRCHSTPDRTQDACGSLLRQESRLH